MNRLNIETLNMQLIGGLWSNGGVPSGYKAATPLAVSHIVDHLAPTSVNGTE